ncbi:hypothetical protein EV401DRAFT_320552 [Pisolithus croceorrhizus]|nr:hypothetical protein EV401DRAFT_320552 [Pisolithus croceorrhizus]
MALNEHNIGTNRTAGAYPGIANPTPHSASFNPMATDRPTEETGPGTGSQLGSHRDDAKHAQREAMHTRRASAGVVEGHPGIIESSHIEPLDEEYKEGEAGRGRTMGRSTPMQTQALKERISAAAEGAANIVYGVATGDQQATNAGREALGFNQ